MKKYIFVFVFALALVGSLAFADVMPTPTSTISPSPSVNPSPSVSAMPTPTPSISPSPSATPVVVTPIPTGTPVATPGACQVVPLHYGDSSDDVKELQSFLSKDKSIYPEGVATGFFGSLTQKAVKRLQERLGIETNGEIDEHTMPFVFPCVTMHVDSPNGGESFAVGSVMHITWDMTVTSPTTGVQNWMPGIQGLMHGEGEKEGLSRRMQGMMLYSATTSMPMMPVLSKVSIDLVEPVPGLMMGRPCIAGFACPPSGTGLRVVAHIGESTTSNQPGSSTGSFDWTIPQTIPQASDYQIRVSALRASDVSNGGFTILGGQTVPSVTPLPIASGTSDQLVRMRTQVMNMIQKMQDVLTQINAALQALGVTAQ